MFYSGPQGDTVWKVGSASLHLRLGRAVDSASEVHAWEGTIGKALVHERDDDGGKAVLFGDIFKTAT